MSFGCPGIFSACSLLLLLTWAGAPGTVNAAANPSRQAIVSVDSTVSALQPVHVAPLKGLELASELRALTRPDLWIQLHDRDYVVIDHQWLEKMFLPHFQKFIHSLGIQLTPEGLDCDNFVQLFRTQLVIANLLAGGHSVGDVPCALAQLRTQNPFGGVPANPAVLHALVIIRTNTGWHVVEPQTMTILPLDAYPDRNVLLTVSI